MRKNLLNALALGLIWAASAQAGLYDHSFNSATSTNGLDFGGTLWDAQRSYRDRQRRVDTKRRRRRGRRHHQRTGRGRRRRRLPANDLRRPACGVAPTCLLLFSVWRCFLPGFRSGRIRCRVYHRVRPAYRGRRPQPADGLSIDFARLTDPHRGAQCRRHFRADERRFGLAQRRAVFRRRQFGEHQPDRGWDHDRPFLRVPCGTAATTPFRPVLPAVGVEAAGITHDGIGMDIRLDGVLLTTIPCPTGRPKRQPTSMATRWPPATPTATTRPPMRRQIETGPYDGTGCDTSLSWCHLKLDLDANDGGLMCGGRTNKS